MVISLNDKGISSIEQLLSSELVSDAPDASDASEFAEDYGSGEGEGEMDYHNPTDGSENPVLIHADEEELVGTGTERTEGVASHTQGSRHETACLSALVCFVCGGNHRPGKCHSVYFKDHTWTRKDFFVWARQDCSAYFLNRSRAVRVAGAAFLVGITQGGFVAINDDDDLVPGMCVAVRIKGDKFIIFQITSLIVNGTTSVKFSHGRGSRRAEKIITVLGKPRISCCEKTFLMHGTAWDPQIDNFPFLTKRKEEVQADPRAVIAEVRAPVMDGGRWKILGVGGFRQLLEMCRDSQNAVDAMVEHAKSVSRKNTECLRSLLCVLLQTVFTIRLPMFHFCSRRHRGLLVLQVSVDLLGLLLGAPYLFEELHLLCIRVRYVVLLIQIASASRSPTQIFDMLGRRLTDICHVSVAARE